MKKRIIAIICLLVALAICMSIAVPAIFGVIASADDLQQKYNQNNQEMNQLNKELQQKRSDRRAKEDEKKRVDEEIAGLNTQIDNLNKVIAHNDAEIEKKEEEIAEVEHEIEESDKLLKMRLRVMYEKGTLSYFEIIFGASSFSDLLVRVDMVRQLVAHDTTLIDKLNVRKTSIVDAKRAIEAAKTENENARAQIAERKKTLDTKSAKSQQLINELRADENYIEEQYQQRVKENDLILKEIRAQTNGGQQTVATASYSGGQLGWPSTLRGTITSEYGPRTLRGKPDTHTGIDIAVPLGTPVLAAEDGVVLSSGWRNGGYGYCVTISHGSITTLYAHNSVLQVSAGQTVKRGQQIALAGSTGNSTGPHIHFGVIINSTGKYTNPRPYIF